MKEKQPLAALAIGRYPLRTCRSLHHCEICGQDITYGQMYYDGGYGRRIHDHCAKLENFNLQGAPPRTEGT